MGRPVGGLKLSALAVAGLPEKGHVHTFARALGVSPNTIKLWIANEGCPFDRVNGHVVLDRKDVTAWLRVTGRLLPLSVADFTDKLTELSPESLDFVRTWAPQVPLSNSFVAQFLKIMEQEKSRHGGRS